MKTKILVELEPASREDLRIIREATGHKSDRAAIAYVLRLAINSDTDHAAMSEQISVELQLAEMDRKRSELLQAQTTTAHAA